MSATPSIPCVTLTTDFGCSDTWVGQVKGALYSVAPEARVVDLCHEVPPQDVRAGAYLLEVGYGAFPPGTIHVAVVDPGVGTSRRRVAVETASYRFVGPDNGLLSRALRHETVVAAHEIAEPRYMGPRRSATFDGRDVFAPAAAWLARGIEVGELGPPAGPLHPLEPPAIALRAGRDTSVPVVHVDRFGNVVLDVRAEEAAAALGGPVVPGAALAAETPGGTVGRIARTYADACGDTPVLLVNSAGYLELAVDGGRADTRLGLRAGDTVTLVCGPGLSRDPRPAR